MPLPDLPNIVQVNWTKAGTSGGVSPWEQPHANILCEYESKPTLIDLDVRTGLYYPTVPPDTLTVTSADPDWNVVRDKADSVLAGSSMIGCPIRAAHQDTLGSGVWRPTFMGYVAKVEPDPLDVPRSKAKVKITALSPIAYLSIQNITPQALPAGAPIYQNDVDSALKFLLQAAGLWLPGWMQLESTPVGIPLPADWGGQPVQFAQALVDLCFLAGTAIYAYPLLGGSLSDPDWMLKWWTPLIGPPPVHYDQHLRDLDQTPSIQWGMELR